MRHITLCVFWATFWLLAVAARAEPMHGIAMHGKPMLQREFRHLPYVNLDAPRGGRAVFAEIGAFDSLNPYILRGRAPWPVQAHTAESLMARNYAEPFALYGLLAETVETPADRSWVAFTLRRTARFSDGSPVTVDDVIWSLETLGTEGSPAYRAAWQAVASIRADGERRVRIDFNTPNRELPLIMALRPILKREQWHGRDFTQPGMEPVIGSGPYVIAAAEPGVSITFRRNPDWWGADLPINRGLNNFDEVHYDYFRNGDALWEAVKTGSVSIFAEPDPVRWVEGYADLPILAEGRMAQRDIPHGRPSGMQGFVFNTRRAPFDDRRVREALALAFDWEWINARVYRGAYRRITSYFGNSDLAFDGSAEGRETELLKPYAADLPEGLLETGWQLPTTDGTGRDRRLRRRAGRLLDAAGWTVADGQRRNAEGDALAFEILVRSTEHERLASIWAEALARFGVTATIRLVDGSQFAERRRDFDYDVTVARWAMSLSPGTEQQLYFDSAARETPGSRNYMGVASPAVDAAIDALLAAEEPAPFKAAVRALDRVLTAGIYVVPFGYAPVDRIAALTGFDRPDRVSLYGGWWGWWSGPGLWWAEPD